MNQVSTSAGQAGLTFTSHVFVPHSFLEEFTARSKMIYRVENKVFSSQFFVVPPPSTHCVHGPSRGSWHSPEDRSQFFCFLFLGHALCAACGILVPRPGVKPASPAVEARSLNHWTTREVPRSQFLSWSVYTLL